MLCQSIWELYFRFALGPSAPKLKRYRRCNCQICALATALQSASSLTLKVLGTVKNAVVVCLGIGLLGEHVTLLQVRLNMADALCRVACGIAMVKLQMHACDRTGISSQQSESVWDAKQHL